MNGAIGMLQQIVSSAIFYTLKVSGKVFAFYYKLALQQTLQRFTRVRYLNIFLIIRFFRKLYVTVIDPIDWFNGLIALK